MKKQTKPKRPRGQPEKLVNVDYAKVEALAARGMDKTTIAECLGVHYMTLNRKEKSDPKFEAAIKKGQAAGVAMVTGQLLKNINLGNVTAIIFYLKCRAHWKETTVIETKDLPLIPMAECSNEDAEAAYMQTMRGDK